MKKLAVSGAILLCLALAKPSIAEMLTLEVGQTVLLDRYAHFNKNCETTGYVNFDIKPDPKLGKFESKRESFTIARSSHGRCVGDSMSGMAAYYTAGDKLGTDTFTLIRTNRHGKQTELPFTIEIK